MRRVQSSLRHLEQVPGGQESTGAGAAAGGGGAEIKSSLTMILETAWQIKASLERYGA